MKTWAEIGKAFNQKGEDAISSLAEWDYAELKEVRHSIWLDCNYSGGKEYYRNRIHLIDEAIKLKRDIDEIPYTL